MSPKSPGNKPPIATDQRLSFSKVEAPTQFNVVSGKRVVLHNGRLSASVPADGVGFTVDTPEAEVVDFGTEFSVDVASETSEVHVFDGLVSNDTLPITTWRHLIVTADGDQLQLYEYGRPVASTPCESMATSTNDTLWFGTTPSGSEIWNGRIDEVAIFDKALSDGEIAELYQAALEEIARAK